MEDCIFCKIANGEIPSSKVFENDQVFAFDDIAPQAPVHVLVVPKQHYKGLDDDVPKPLLGELLWACHEVARIKELEERGYRVIVNTGPESGQSVPHLHLHVLGGRQMSEGMMRFADEG